jgi:hypothetical protein
MDRMLGIKNNTLIKLEGILGIGSNTLGRDKREGHLDDYGTYPTDEHKIHK